MRASSSRTSPTAPPTANLLPENGLKKKEKKLPDFHRDRKLRPDVTKVSSRPQRSCQRRFPSLHKVLDATLYRFRRGIFPINMFPRFNVLFNGWHIQVPVEEEKKESKDVKPSKPLLFPDPTSSDHVVALTKLNDQVLSLQRQLAEKDKQLIAKDRQICELKADMAKQDRDARSKLQDTLKQHADKMSEMQVCAMIFVPLNICLSVPQS